MQGFFLASDGRQAVGDREEILNIMITCSMNYEFTVQICHTPDFQLCYPCKCLARSPIIPIILYVICGGRNCNQPQMKY